MVILNGVPRSGKSSIALALVEAQPGVWINHGVDASMAATPDGLLPGIGLRPGGERPDLEPDVERLYREIRALRIYEGTSEIQKLIIAGEALSAAEAEEAAHAAE